MKKENRQKVLELASNAEKKEKLKGDIEKALTHIDVEPLTLVRWRGLIIPIESSVLRAQLESQKASIEGELLAVESELDKL